MQSASPTTDFRQHAVATRAATRAGVVAPALSAATINRVNRLRQSFESFRAAGRKALLPYVTAGFPDLETTIAILRGIDPQRCACVELGIPFSDPIADGPVIQASFYAAIERGFRVDALWTAIGAARAEIVVPLVAMVSYSIVHRRDPRRFVSAAHDAGIDGLIVPDLSFEEAEELAGICRAAGCPLVMMIAPTTAPDRQAKIAALSEPFIYYQSLAGVTGERSNVASDLATHVEAIRRLTPKPVCVGFGIATPQQVRTVAGTADGVIVGSAIVRRINDAVVRGDNRAAIAAAAGEFIRELGDGLTG